MNKQPLYITNTVCITIVVLVFLLFFAIADPVYENNDDMRMIAIYSGRMGFPSSDDAVFMSNILGTIFHNLYLYNQNIPWYSLTLYVFHLISLSFGIKLILSLTQLLNTRLFLIFCYFSLYSVIFYSFSFTSTSLLLWFMVIVYVLYLNLIGKKPDITELFLGLLLIISFLIRPGMINIALAFSFPVLISFFIPKIKLRFLYVIMPLVIVIFISNIYSDTFLSRHRNNGYRELQSARNSLTDTVWGQPGNNFDMALDAAGWTEADYNLIKISWTHTEELFNVDRMNTFLRHNKNKDFILPISVINISNIIYYSSLILILFLTALIFIGSDDISKKYKYFGSGFFNKSRLKKSIVLSHMLLIIGFIILAMIKIAPRVAVPILLYYFLLLLVTIPIINEIYAFKGGFVKSRLKELTASFFIIFIAIFQFLYFHYTSNYHNSIKEIHNDNISILSKEYGEDVIFVQIAGDAYLSSAHPLKEYGDIVEFNKIPGKWVTNTETYYAFLNSYGLSCGQDFIRYSVNNNKVIYRFREDANYSFSENHKYFVEHINNHYSSKFPDSKLILDIILVKEIESSSLKWHYFKLISK